MFGEKRELTYRKRNNFTNKRKSSIATANPVQKLARPIQRSSRTSCFLLALVIWQNDPLDNALLRASEALKAAAPGLYNNMFISK